MTINESDLWPNITVAIKARPLSGLRYIVGMALVRLGFRVIGVNVEVNGEGDK